jgi:hypothetical protein
MQNSIANELSRNNGERCGMGKVTGAESTNLEDDFLVVWLLQHSR